jgi:hypothetical protein
MKTLAHATLPSIISYIVMALGYADAVGLAGVCE